MNNNRLTVGSWIAQPRAAWRAIDDVDKVVLYSRWSLHLVILFVTSINILVVFRSGSAEDFAMAAAGAEPKAVIVAASILCATVTIAVIEVLPQMNIKPRRPVGPLMLGALSTHLILWSSGVALYFLAPEWQWAGAGIYLVNSATMCATWGLIPWLKRPFLIAVIVGAITDAIFWNETGFLYTWFSLLGVALMRSSEWVMQIIKDLHRARETESQLKVSEERLRFAQELHDTMGQHLAAISLKAQLARALAARNDERLDGELEQLQQLASQSSDEMRRVVRGYRAINLATEVRGARELLESAGIAVQVNGVSTDVPAPARDLCAWLVRESATNVLRHSTASHVSIDLAETGVRITNDGAHAETIGAPGGLGSLRRKAEEVGATLMFATVADRQRGASFRVECDVSAVEANRAHTKPAGLYTAPVGERTEEERS